MAAPDPEREFAALEAVAHAALDHPEALAPVLRVKPLLTLWSAPAFGPHRSWVLLDTPGADFQVREALWERVPDLAAFAEQFPGHQIPRPSAPTLVVQDARIARTALASLLAEAEALPLPTAPAHFTTAAVECSAVRFDSRPGAPRFDWGWEIPAGGEALAAWFLGMREVIEKALLQGL
ncbi:MAG: hypothetical protein K8T20_05805 [Planctomycetes bacterium]|nr:hypothetical protein [Planctomycetota bacterium]